MNAYLAALLDNPSGVRTLADLIAFNDDNPTLEKPTNFTDQSQFVVLSSKVPHVVYVFID